MDVDHQCAVSQKNDDISPDLIEAVDSLLDEIEETTQSYSPKEEKGFDPNALVTDDGTIAPPPAPEAETPEPEENHDSDSDSDSEPIESNDSAQDALDAIEEVEIQAEDLVSQSIGALLDEAESTAEAIQDSDHADEHTEPLQSTGEVVKEMIEDVVEDAVAEKDPVEEIDAKDILASIDDLLEAAEVEDEQVEAEAAESESPSETPSETPIDSAADSAQGVDETEEPADPDAEPSPSDQIETVHDDSESEQTLEADIETATAPETVAVQDTTSSDAFDESMDMLDSALSEAADDMLDGDFETEEGELVCGEAVSTAIEEALESQPKPEVEEENVTDELLSPSTSDEADPAAQSTPESTPAQEPDTSKVAQMSPTPEPTPESAAEPVAPAPSVQAPDPTAKDSPAEKTTATVAAAPTAAVQDLEIQSEIDALEHQETKEPIAVPAWLERCVEVVRPRIDKIDPLKGKSMDALAMALGLAIATTITHTTPLIARGTILLSKPLAKQSPETRNAIGFIAMWTGFLGVVLWSYLLLFRTPTTPQPEVAPSRVISAEESLIVNPAINVLP